MARVVKIVKTLRNHWKKSTFAAVAGSYGVYYLYNKHQDNLVRREFCKLAVEYGKDLVHATEKAKKVTVFLNPAAKNGKARKLFEKNAAPILHLAGFNVEIVQSGHEGHTKDQTASLAGSDVIVVVGGDGTLAEAVTGLLRRPDEESVSRWPIGVIPAGVTNTLARVLHIDSKDEVRWMCNAALAVVKGITVPIDVIAIKDSDGRTTYALNHLKWSPFDDAREQNTKYWYFGPLKHRMAHIFYTISKNWPAIQEAHVAFTGPKDIPVPPIPPLLPSIWTRFYWRLFGAPQEPEEVEVEEEVARTEKELSSTELTITANQLQEINSKKSLCLNTGPKEIDRISFIKEGWRRLNSHEPESAEYALQTEHVGDIDVKPQIPEDLTAWYTIDSERFEAGPVSITLLPNKLRFFSQLEPTSDQSGTLEQSVER